MQTHLKGFSSVEELVVLGGFDQVTVITALLQLHHDVQETRRAAFGSFAQRFVVPCQDPSGRAHTH